MPASLAGADTSLRSSRNPTPKITVAASTTPSGSDDPAWKISRNWWICAATAMATRNARYMAAPPHVGMGLSCTFRAPGMTTQPNRIAAVRTPNVARYVTSAATARTAAYPAIRTTPEVDGRPSQVGVGRELGAEHGGVVAQGGEL